MMTDTTFISGDEIGYQFNSRSNGNRRTDAKIRECKDCGRQVVRYARFVLTVKPFTYRDADGNKVEVRHLFTAYEVHTSERMIDGEWVKSCQYAN
jgi:hypothetical protein